MVAGAWWAPVAPYGGAAAVVDALNGATAAVGSLVASSKVVHSSPSLNYYLAPDNNNNNYNFN